MFGKRRQPQFYHTCSHPLHYLHWKIFRKIDILRKNFIDFIPFLNGKIHLGAHERLEFGDEKLLLFLGTLVRQAGSAACVPYVALRVAFQH
jgi:hypothetical protein